MTTLLATDTIDFIELASGLTATYTPAKQSGKSKLSITATPSGAGEVGQTPIAVTNTNIDLTPTQMLKGIIKITGTATNDSKVIKVPQVTTDAEVGYRLFRNTNTRIVSVGMVGGGSPIALSPGDTMLIGYDSSGVFPCVNSIPT